MTPVRVMAYSIVSGRRHGPSMREVVRGVAPDVLLASGGPRTPVVWSRQASRLAESWRLRLVAGGPAAGANMVLTGAAGVVKSAGDEVLSRRPLTARRGLAWAQLRSRDGVLFGVVACRLSLDPATRLGELDHVVRAVGHLRGPVVVAGDMDEPPDGPTRCRLRELGFTDQLPEPEPTGSAGPPGERGTAVLVRGAAACMEDLTSDVPSELIASAGGRRPLVVVVDV